MATVTKRMKGIGDALVYVVGPQDKGVSVSLVGKHQCYGLVAEGSTAGPSGPWVKLEIFLPVPGGRHELAPGAFDVTVFNQSKYFAVDTANPLPLTHVRIRLQQWFGNEQASIDAVVEGVSWTPKSAADTGGNQAFSEIKGVVLVRPSGEASSSGETAEANMGGDYRQLVVGANVTALSAGGSFTLLAQTRGPDGVWYTVWSSEALAGPGQVYASIGVGLHVNRMFGNIVRLAWAVTGSATFSAMAMGKTLPP